MFKPETCVAVCGPAAEFDGLRGPMAGLEPQCIVIEGEGIQR